MDKTNGSMETLSAMQVTADTEGLDAQSKVLLYSPEVLAVILQETVPEYRTFTRRQIMDFIERESFSESTEVSPGRTNSQLRADSPEFVQLNEKTSMFDLAFRAKNPLLSNENVRVNLHIDFEPQKNYRPGYPIEKRGIYYLARRLSAQLSLVTESASYSSLEKCCSIWICRDRIPVRERYTISYYSLENTANTGPCHTPRADYDLMSLVIIRLGSSVYSGKEGDEGYGLLRFLNALMYPHRPGFMDTVSDYIDFSANKELWKEAKHMSGLGESILEEGREEGRELERDKIIHNLIRSDLKDHVSADCIIQKIQNYFDVSREMAEQYFQKFTPHSIQE